MDGFDLASLRAVAQRVPHILEQILERTFARLVEGQADYAIFDGGANLGWHTIRFLRLPGCRRVYAVEADPFIARSFHTNMDDWKAASSPAELVVVEKALQQDPEATKISWMSSPSHPGRASIVSLSDTSATIHSGDSSVEYRERFDVPATTIDQILAKETLPLPILKLDLEGADYIALTGARHTMQTARPVIAYENSALAPKVHGYTTEDMRRTFAALGYTPCSFLGDPLGPSEMFSFWEAWACPEEQVAKLKTAIDGALADLSVATM